MSRYYIPALGNLYARLESLVLPLLRAGLGIILMAHGCQKLFGLFGGMGLNANAALFERLGYQPGHVLGHAGRLHRDRSAACCWCSACSPGRPRSRSSSS